MTIYENETPDRTAFIEDLRHLGYTVEKPQSPLHLQGVKSECIIISRESDDNGFNFALRLDFDRYDFYPAGMVTAMFGNEPVAISKPETALNRNYAEVVSFSEHMFTCVHTAAVYYSSYKQQIN